MTDQNEKTCDNCGHPRTNHYDAYRSDARSTACSHSSCSCGAWIYNIEKEIIDYSAREMNRTRDLFEGLGIDPYATVQDKRRTELFKKADELVNGSREEIYGPPEINFQTIADLWTAMGFRVQSWNGDIRNINATDVALGMTQVKMGRLRTSPDHVDTWVDGIGYLGLGGEVATKGQNLPWQDKSEAVQESESNFRVDYEYIAIPGSDGPDSVRYFYRCGVCHSYTDENDFASHAWNEHGTRDFIVSDSVFNQVPVRKLYPLCINFTLLSKKRFSRKPPRVQCDECQATMNYSFIQTHMDVVHPLTMNYIAPSLKSS